MTDEQERERTELLASRLSAAGQEINGLKKDVARLEGTLKDNREIVSNAIAALGDLRADLMPDGKTLADAVRVLVSRAAMALALAEPHWAKQLADIRSRGWHVITHHDLPDGRVLWAFEGHEHVCVAYGEDDADAIAAVHAKVVR